MPVSKRLLLSFIVSTLSFKWPRIIFKAKLEVSAFKFLKPSFVA